MKKNMMLIAILAIVAVVIVVLAIVLLMGLGGSGSSGLTVVGKDTTNVNSAYWGLNDYVSVEVTVKNNAAVTTSGTINVKIVTTVSHFGPTPTSDITYTSVGTKSITLPAGGQDTYTIDVSIGVDQGAMLSVGTVTTVTMS
jgi:uncharacterized protein (UPF0333 family)